MLRCSVNTDVVTRFVKGTHDVFDFVHESRQHPPIISTRDESLSHRRKKQRTNSSQRVYIAVFSSGMLFHGELLLS